MFHSEKNAAKDLLKRFPSHSGTVKTKLSMFFLKRSLCSFFGKITGWKRSYFPVKFKAGVLRRTTLLYLFSGFYGNSVHAGCSCGHLEASPPPPPPWWTFLYRLHVCNFHTGILACVVDNVFINLSHRSPRMFRFFSFFETIFYHFFFTFTVVIKRAGELRGESAASGDRPASSMSKYSPVWTLTSEMVPFGSKSMMLSM